MKEGSQRGGNVCLNTKGKVGVLQETGEGRERRVSQMEGIIRVKQKQEPTLLFRALGIVWFCSSSEKEM